VLVSTIAPQPRCHPSESWDPTRRGRKGEMGPCFRRDDTQWGGAPSAPHRTSRLRSPWLCAGGGRGRGGVVGPGVAGVAAAHVLGDVFPRAAPEAWQVAGGLDRTVGGREQDEGQRD